MAQIKHIFEKNFLEYASYVIKDRAIPDIQDGLKPVQRRILYTLYKMDDGTTHKVAAVIGQAMFLHPHGDSSIYEALVNLANKDLFIEKQGNFGNIFTGDRAAAARYIECALSPFAKELLFNDETTAFASSYDGKMQEPIVLPVKIPLALILGAEGIAVGMSTRILPHNFVECLQAMQASLRGESFQLLPDFPTAGLLDATDYKDGLGKVVSRAKLDLSDPKRIVVRELSFGSTCESLIQSIEDAARKNKLKVGSINDFTAGQVEIEIELPRGTYAADVEAALYAFTDCETVLHTNCLLIVDRKPQVLSVSEVIHFHAQHVQELFRRELEVEKHALLGKIRARTLERIFIEERIYKSIEELKSAPAIVKSVKAGLLPFQGVEFEEAVNDDDVERLLKLPIRRISLFDIEKNRKELSAMLKRVKEINYSLVHLVEHTLNFLDVLIAAQQETFPRHTTIAQFTRVDMREAALRNLKLRYDEVSGYMGTQLSTGEVVSDCSQYDRVLQIAQDLSYKVIEVPEKLFVGKKALYTAMVDKEKMEDIVFNIIYKQNKTGYPYIKRFKITQFIIGRAYSSLLPEDATLLAFGLGDRLVIVPTYKQASLVKDEEFLVSQYLIKGVQAGGVRIKNKEVLKARLKEKKRKI
jgi:topoisomerase-4 subunit A